MAAGIKIYALPLDFCPELHILKVGNVTKAYFHDATKKRRLPVVLVPGAFLLLVLAALEEQTIKPLAEIVGYYLCSDSLYKCDEKLQ